MTDLVRFAPPAVLAVGAALLFGARDQQRVPPRAPLASIALSTPGYTPRDTTVDKVEQQVAGMSHYLSRIYDGPTKAQGFGVYVGYYDYQVQGKSIHSPKNCLPGAGWEPVEQGVRPVVLANGDTARVNRYLLSNKGAQALVYYWYQGRGRVEASEYKVKWNLIRDAARYGRTEESLVRIVVPVDARGLAPGQRPDYRHADSLATAVAAQLVPAVARVTPAAPGAA